MRKGAAKSVRALDRLGVSSEAIAAVCRKHGLKALSFFGPITRADFGDRSEVGVLVEFVESVPATRMMLLREVLVELFDRRPVEVVTPAIFTSCMWRKRAIQRQEQKIFPVECGAGPGGLADGRWSPTSRRRKSVGGVAAARRRR